MFFITVKWINNIGSVIKGEHSSFLSFRPYNKDLTCEEAVDEIIQYLQEAKKLGKFKKKAGSSYEEGVIFNFGKPHEKASPRIKYSVNLPPLIKE